MKLHLAVVPLLLGACLTTPADDDAPADELGVAAAEVAVEIGACGANQDPSTGVTCTYTPGDPIGYGNYTGASVETGGDGRDYLECHFDVTCAVTGTATGGGGVACASVVGTGCNDTTTTVRVGYPRLLPPGAPAPSPAVAAAMCALGYDTIVIMANVACKDARPVVVEQGEDLCCVTRAPIPGQPPLLPRIFVEP